ncbi:MAG: transcriptional regulator [Candidatus Rokuibacteriota bacterium]|nr:MAG: transcriptional regulator [Candidatus Rokubacteria bacterium]
MITTVTREKVQVPLLDLRGQWEQIQAEVMEAIHDVCASQRFILGPRVKELEERIAAYSQCRHGIGMSSGTDALLAALMALEVGPGDEVITTPFTFFATAGTVARLGARAVFCDIDPVTYNLSADAVEDFVATQCEPRLGSLVNRRTGGRVKVLMPVHVFGQSAEMDRLAEVAQRSGLKIVEDAAQALGAEDRNGRRAGSIGDIGCFSFFPSKNLGAFGDGGMCTTNDPELAARLEALRVHGARRRYYHELVGGNFRLDALQAAVLLVKLRYLDRWTELRQENARWYDGALECLGLGERLTSPRRLAGYRHVFNQYVLRAERRDALREHLAGAGIGTEVYYPVALHMQACFSSLGYRPEDCPEARRAAGEAVAIPIYPELTAAQRQYVVDTIAAFYR